MVYPHFEKPPVEVEAHVIDTGYAGVTVEHTGEYGGMMTKTVDTQGGYALGDTVILVLDGRSGTLK